ncbi:hypothetical protein I6G96_26860 [Delftia acidovorans]|uniref:hypothetical protein n=1 Tax=Delftia acidovorans TaxID=80866 RepID=UPI0018D908BD|nr:hypothetical protein [Delftia acidovorans]QPR34498.1 hypothetical protein I6G96_26860 [Delftia acidovorans]
MAKEQRVVTSHFAHYASYQMYLKLLTIYNAKKAGINLVNGVNLEEEGVLVFMAFTIEGFINAVGFNSIENWDSIERKPWRSKLKTLKNINSNGFSSNDGIDKMIEKIFNFRDKMAHGKPAISEGPWIPTSGGCDFKKAIENNTLEKIKNPVLHEAMIMGISKIPFKIEEIFEYILSMVGGRLEDYNLAYKNVVEYRD